MQINPLPLESQAAAGGNYEVLVTHDDLTDAVASEAQTLTVPIKAKMSARVRRSIVDVPFENSSSAGNNVLGVTVGDGGSVGRFLTSTEVNKNGSYIPLKSGVDIEYPYTVDDTIDITFTPKTGATLLSLDAGRMRFILDIQDARQVAPAP